MASGTTSTSAEYGCYSLKGEADGNRALVRIRDTAPTVEILQSFPQSNDLEVGFYDFAWFDDRWWTCMNHLSWLEPVSGDVHETDIDCYAMVVADGEFLIHRSWDVHEPWRSYPSAADLIAGNPTTSTVHQDWPVFSRVGYLAGSLYTSIHVTNHLWVMNLGNEAVREMPLEGFDTWNWGIAVTDDGKIRVLDDGRQEGMESAINVWEFDANSGEQVNRIRIGTRPDVFNGLWCGIPAP